MAFGKQDNKGERMMSTNTNALLGIKYLDMQAYVGITKHNGGFAATNELLSLCHIEAAREVLNVGCGIGVGVAYIAKKYGCHVVGVDISKKMIEWSQRRAREERVEDRVELRVADVLDLPFEADLFDTVIVESVIAFVEDKARAVRELVRVTKPGGYIGLNEAFWTQAPPPEVIELASRIAGTKVPLLETWQALWDTSGLHERVVNTYPLDARQEIRDRMQWVGRTWALKGFARLFALYLKSPSYRRSLKEQFSGQNVAALQQIGYGLFVGRK